MKELLAQAKEAFNVVLLDTPPVLAVIDPVIVSSLADSTVFVVRAGKTTAAVPRQRAIEEVRQVQGRHHRRRLQRGPHRAAGRSGRPSTTTTSTSMKSTGRRPKAPARSGRSHDQKALDYGLLALLLLEPAAGGFGRGVVGLRRSSWPRRSWPPAYVLLEPKPALNPHLPPLLRQAEAGRRRPLRLPRPAGRAAAGRGRPASSRRRATASASSTSPGSAGRKFMSLSIVPSATIATGSSWPPCSSWASSSSRRSSAAAQVRALLAVLVASGVFQALYGLFELTRDDPRLLFYKKVFSPDSVTGTFVNRNHFSGYLEMIIPLALGLAIARMNMMTFGVRGFREKLLLWTSKGILVNVLVTGGGRGHGRGRPALELAVGRGRPGLHGLPLLRLLGRRLQPDGLPPALDREDRPGRPSWCVTILAVVIGVGSTVRRFAARRPPARGPAAATGPTPPRSSATSRSSGRGLGTFAAAYGAYEDAGLSEMRLVHAHNDYLEYVAELGVVGAVLLLGIVLYHRRLGLPGPSGPAERPGPGAGPGRHRLARPAWASTPFTDFNLHIPANMVLFTVVLCTDPGHGLLPEKLRSSVKKKTPDDRRAGGPRSPSRPWSPGTPGSLLAGRSRSRPTPRPRSASSAGPKRSIPWNDEVAVELGRAYFEPRRRGPGRPGQARHAAFELVRRPRSSARSGSIPASSAAHFELAQTLLYMSYLCLPVPLALFRGSTSGRPELTGHNSQIHYDAGKVLLGRWRRARPRRRTSRPAS
ncbi:MAG: hypothetical protein MZU95_01585 [Desulfomicrobium escambiense]|nr:hypothetical protein [Desulfomicrobium escambiense]